MKKMMMLAVLGMLGTAGATVAVGSLTAPLKFKATVDSVCQVVTAPPTATSTGLSFANNPVVPLTVPPTMGYNASMVTGPSTGGALSGIGLRIQCTKGTPLNVTLTPSGGTVVGPENANGITKNALMQLARKNGDGTLNGQYSFSMAMENNGSAGDLYTGNASYQIDPNQWNAPAGDYEGTLLVQLSYN